MDKNKVTDQSAKKKSRGSAILRLFQGALVGVGGILPGISGGVMCAIFGLYQPIMEFIAHPIKNFKKHFFYLLPAGIGLVLGFLGLSKLVLAVFSSNEIIATCVFVGLILGMLPSLWSEAGKEGRKKSSYITMGIGFAVIFTIFLVLEFAAGINVKPSPFWFFVSGVLFSLGIVVPGMSASSPLLYLGLMEPLLAVASSFLDGALDFVSGKLSFAAALSAMQFDALIPFLLGIAVVFITLSRLVNHLVKKYYSQFYHGIFGVVVATTLPILIFKLEPQSDLLVKLACIVLGFAGAVIMDIVTKKFEEK